MARPERGVVQTANIEAAVLFPPRGDGGPGASGRPRHSEFAYALIGILPIHLWLKLRVMSLPDHRLFAEGQDADLSDVAVRRLGR
jgi:hypothetical protein